MNTITQSIKKSFSTSTGGKHKQKNTTSHNIKELVAMKKYPDLE